MEDMYQRAKGLKGVAVVQFPYTRRTVTSLMTNLIKVGHLFLTIQPLANLMYSQLYSMQSEFIQNIHNVMKYAIQTDLSCYRSRISTKTLQLENISFMTKAVLAQSCTYFQGFW